MNHDLDGTGRVGKWAFECRFWEGNNGRLMESRRCWMHVATDPLIACRTAWPKTLGAHTCVCCVSLAATIAAVGAVEGRAACEGINRTVR